MLSGVKNLHRDILLNTSCNCTALQSLQPRYLHYTLHRMYKPRERLMDCHASLLTFFIAYPYSSKQHRVAYVYILAMV